MLGRLRFEVLYAWDRLRPHFGMSMRCEPMGDRDAMERRVSRYDSHRFSVGSGEVLVCYSRPKVDGRQIFGGLVPYGELWRTGANEPTILHLSDAVRVAGVRVPRGRYALYTVPGEHRWTLVVNRSVRQWGLTRDERGPRGTLFLNQYHARVAAAELGRVDVPSEPIEHVEELTFRSERHDERRTDLLMEWATTRVSIPLEALSA